MLIASLGLPWGTYPEWSSCGTSQISDWGATSIHSLHQLPADLRRSSQFTHDERRCQAAVLSGDRLLVKQQQILHASSSNPHPFCTSNHQQKRHKKTQVSLKCSDPNFSAKANEFPKDALQASGPFYQDPLVTPILETRLRSAAVSLGIPPTSAWSCEDLAHLCSRQGWENKMLAIEN